MTPLDLLARTITRLDRKGQHPDSVRCRMDLLWQALRGQDDQPCRWPGCEDHPRWTA